MDKELKHEKICQVLKTEQEKHFSSSRQAVLVNQWDSVGSDTESLAQERTYLQQLQMLQHGDREDEDVQVYDSLEVEGHPHAKRNPTLLQTEYVDAQLDEREGISQLRSDDAYSDLRYDPNWRTNLMGAGRFSESPRISVEEYQVPLKKSSQAYGYKQGVEVKGDYKYIVDTSPALVITPHMASNQSDQPYHLHPQDGQNTSIAFPHCYNCSLQLRSPEADLSRPSSILTKNESDNASQREIRKKCENGCDDVSRSHEPTEDVPTMYIPERKTFYQQEQRCTQGGSTQTQHINMSVWSSPKILSNKKLEGLKKDIVERNKLTLGRNTSKSGSYVSVHSLKHDKPHNVNKVQITKETASTESQEDSSDLKLRWLQNTQQLRVTQISKGKKAQRKEYLSPPQKERNPSPGVRDELGDCLSSPLARPAPVTQPKPQKTTSSQPLSPTFHLNINLKTSSHLPPLLQPRGQEAIINMASLHDCPHGSFASQTELAQLSGYPQTNPSKYSQISWKGVNIQLHHRNLESSPEQWQRITAIKWPLSCDGDEQTWSPNDHPRKPAAGKQLSPGPNVNPAYAIHRSSSDGYLVQMEKQMQLKTRVAYKAYSLKDYKQLKSDVILQGLGPDYRALEKTAEKMKRQRLYSNVIHEQNKKISRIPFLLAKDLEGNDKKVPRMKALEYAKTIAKPPVQPQPKQRRKHQSEGFTKHCPYLEALDMSPPATLEVLRKRHEEEKKAVALFRKEHVV